MTMAGPRRAVLAALVLAMVCAGCGLSAEKQPRQITDGTITGLLAPTSTTTPTGDRRATLYFVNGDQLAPIQVAVGSGPTTADQVLHLLLAGPPPTAGKGLTTSIPQTTLVGTRLQGSTLLIDLKGQIESLGGSAAKAAYAQLVFTTLLLPGVDSVRFAIEGQNIDAITDDGSRAIIRASNYKPPLKPRQ